MFWSFYFKMEQPTAGSGCREAGLLITSILSLGDPKTCVTGDRTWAVSVGSISHKECPRRSNNILERRKNETEVHQ